MDRALVPKLTARPSGQRGWFDRLDLVDDITVPPMLKLDSRGWQQIPSTQRAVVARRVAIRAAPGAGRHALAFCGGKRFSIGCRLLMGRWLVGKWIQNAS